MEQGRGRTGGGAGLGRIGLQNGGAAAGFRCRPTFLWEDCWGDKFVALEDGPPAVNLRPAVLFM